MTIHFLAVSFMRGVQAFRDKIHDLLGRDRMLPIKMVNNDETVDFRMLRM